MRKLSETHCRLGLMLGDMNQILGCRVQMNDY